MHAKEIEFCLTEYGEDIYRFCCFLTQSKDKAEDLYQECFLKAMESGIQAQPGKEKPLMIGIAANLWKNKWRKEKRRSRIIVPLELDGNGITEPMNEGTSVVHDLLETYIRGETSRIVANVVDALPDKYRTVVLMYYSAELSTQEIAETLKMSKGTVTSRLDRARKIIRKGLEEIGYER